MNPDEFCTSDQDPDDVRTYCFLAELGGWLTFAAAMTTTRILSETLIDYLRFILGHGPDRWVEGIIIIACAAFILVDFALVYVRTRALRKSLSNNVEPTVLELRSIKVATVGTMVLAIVGSWLAVSLARVPGDWLTAPNIGIVICVLTLTLVLPTIVSTAICYSVASTDE